MRAFRFALVALPCALLAFASTADAQQQRRPNRANAQDSMVERLNQESLARARAGQNALNNQGGDTTQNLNAISDRDAQQGRNMNTAPMPFR